MAEDKDVEAISSRARRDPEQAREADDRQRAVAIWDDFVFLELPQVRFGDFDDLAYRPLRDGERFCSDTADECVSNCQRDRQPEDEASALTGIRIERHCAGQFFHQSP